MLLLVYPRTSSSISNLFFIFFLPQGGYSKPKYVYKTADEVKVQYLSFLLIYTTVGVDNDDFSTCDTGIIVKKSLSSPNRS